MTREKELSDTPQHILTPEQEELLELYRQNLDSFLEELKASDAIQVEIETQHLKRILSS